MGISRYVFGVDIFRRAGPRRCKSLTPKDLRQATWQIPCQTFRDKYIKSILGGHPRNGKRFPQQPYDHGFYRVKKTFPQSAHIELSPYHITSYGDDLTSPV